MSVLPVENNPPDVQVDETTHDDTPHAGTPVLVHRHAGLAALIGAAASAVAIAYLWRASQTMAPLDWALCAVMTVIATVYLAALVDSRTPLLVADELGVRIRLGSEWRGLPWDAINQVVVQPRRGLLRDGRIVFSPHSIGRALDGLDGKAKRHASLNQKMYGAALAVPVGITTRVSSHGERSVAQEIETLSLGRVDVIELAPDPATQPATDLAADPTARESEAATSESANVVDPASGRASSDSDAVAQEPPSTDQLTSTVQPVEPAQEMAASSFTGGDSEAQPARRSILGGLGTVVSRVAKGRRHDVDGETIAPPLRQAALYETGRGQAGDDDGAPLETSQRSGGTAIPLRTTRPALRAEVTRDTPATLGNAALQQAPTEQDPRPAFPEARELRRPGSVDLVFEPASDRVRPISTMGDPVEPLVIDDFVTEPAYDPVIGPELAAARTRVGLSVDELAERTRIRPHVIESIEVDDFAPCGGDFYARGHLRTLARVLGKDPAPLVASFEERYATAPVNARRVFEAELATGMTGSMRSTMAGPNWGLLIGAVLCLVLVWGVVRLFAGAPAELIQNPAPVLNGSAGVESGYPDAGQVVPAAKPLPITLIAAHGDTRVVVRNAEGRIVFSAEMVLGEKKRLDVVPPVRVRAVDAGALEVMVQSKDKGVLGVLGQPGRRTFR